SASQGGLTAPSETPSAIATTSSAPAACAASAISGSVSSTPKKFGDCNTTAATSSFSAPWIAAVSTEPLLVYLISSKCSPEFLAYVCSTSRYSGCTDRATSPRVRPVSRSGISPASVVAVAPSYMEALATSCPVNWHISV